MSQESTSDALYHQDPYRREVDVWVDAMGHDEKLGAYLVFSETICHPHGGGQKGDRGVLVLTDEEAEALNCERELPITDTRRSGERVLHILEASLPMEAAVEILIGAREFSFRLDWAFRHRQMRLHGAAHLLHCIVEAVVGEHGRSEQVPYPDTSDLQPGFGLNRYEIKDLLNEAQAVEVVGRLNAFTAEGHAISTYPDSQRAGFRYWECEKWRIPCGGTHLVNTAEIGPVEVSLNLKRGRTGLTFRLAE